MGQLHFPVTKVEAKKAGDSYSSKQNKRALFPTRLRALRESAGLSQESLAKSLNISKSTVGLYETGDTLPNAKVLFDMAVLYGVSADYLLGLTDFKDARRRACTLEDFGFSQAAVEHIDMMSTVKSLEELGLRSGEDNYKSEMIYDRAAFNMLVRLLETPRFIQFLHNAAVYSDTHIPGDQRIEMTHEAGNTSRKYKTSGAVINELLMQTALTPLIEALREIEKERAAAEEQEASNDAESNG